MTETKPLSPTMPGRPSAGARPCQMRGAWKAVSRETASGKCPICGKPVGRKAGCTSYPQGIARAGSASWAAQDRAQPCQVALHGFTACPPVGGGRYWTYFIYTTTAYCTVLLRIPKRGVRRGFRPWFGFRRWVCSIPKRAIRAFFGIVVGVILWITLQALLLLGEALCQHL